MLKYGGFVADEGCFPVLSGGFLCRPFCAACAFSLRLLGRAVVTCLADEGEVGRRPKISFFWGLSGILFRCGDSF